MGEELRARQDGKAAWEGRGEWASAEETVERTDFWTPNSQGPLVGKVLISSILEGLGQILFKFQSYRKSLRIVR